MALTFDTGDTIAAVATARDGALRGIIRVSGPRAAECLVQVFSPLAGEIIPTSGPPRAIAGTVRASEPLGEVPADIYVWPGARSYTRQASLEIHTFGSPPILDAVLAAICQTGVRLALPGEFTLRAFLAGRIDLTQAEAVLGVIEAHSADQLDIALRQLAGGLTKPLTDLRERLLDLLASLEAGLDFVEEDIEFISADSLDRELAEMELAIHSIRQQMGERGRAANELMIAIVGSPNVGKSSLFNVLAGSDSAIVSCEAGTTRDYVTRSVQIQHRNVTVVDTAGFAAVETTDELDAAMRLAAEMQLRAATLQLFCLDSSRPMNAWEREVLHREPTIPRLVVMTKSDEELRCDFSGEAIATSSRTGAGIDELRRQLSASLDAVESGAEQVVGATSVRCRSSLERAAECLSRARRLIPAGYREELVAAEIRLALDEIGVVVGAVYTDDVLDRVFSRFCIGK